MNSDRCSLTVYFDYTCPFAYKANLWFDHLDSVDAMWQPFSLLEKNYRGDGPPVWQLADRVDDISLVLFGGHCWVDADGADLDHYRHVAFRAWHDLDADLRIDDVVAMATEAGAVGGTEELRSHFLDAESVHDAARQLGVFGSPTLVFASGAAAFIKLDQPPTAANAQQVLDAVATMAELRSVLEVKRPTPPRQINAQRLDVDAS